MLWYSFFFQGQFQQNRVQGKGNYVWPDGSTYEGDVVNGLRHGCGTFVSADKKSSYNGEWHGGKRNGKVIKSIGSKRNLHTTVRPVDAVF